MEVSVHGPFTSSRHGRLAGRSKGRGGVACPPALLLGLGSDCKQHAFGACATRGSADRRRMDRQNAGLGGARRWSAYWRGARGFGGRVLADRTTDGCAGFRWPRSWALATRIRRRSRTFCRRRVCVVHRRFQRTQLADVRSCWLCPTGSTCWVESRSHSNRTVPRQRYCQPPQVNSDDTRSLMWTCVIPLVRSLALGRYDTTVHSRRSLRQHSSVHHDVVQERRARRGRSLLTSTN